MSFRVIAIAAVATLGIAAQASAGVLYDNLGATGAVGDGVSASGPLADSFSTGSVGFALSDVKILMAVQTPSDGGSFTVSLLSDSSTSPGSVLDAIGTVLDNSLTTAYGVTDFDLSTSYDLAADTRYWIELVGADDSSALWSRTAIGSGGTGVAGQYFYLGGVPGVYSNAHGPFAMEVSGSPLSTVPEPASLALLGSALVGFGLLRRRKS